MNENPILVERWGFAFPNYIPQSHRNRKEFLQDFVEFLQDDAATEYEVRGSCRLYGIIYRPNKEPDNSFLSLDIDTIKKSGDDFIMEINKLTVRVKRADYCKDLRNLLLDFAKEQAAPAGSPPKISKQHGHYLWYCHCKYGQEKNLL